MKISIQLAILSLILFSCEKNEDRIQDYFIPIITDEGISKTYTYVSPIDSQKLTWVYEKSEEENRVHGSLYLNDESLVKEIEMIWTEEDVQMHSASLVEYDSLGNPSRSPYSFDSRSLFPLSKEKMQSILYYSDRYQSRIQSDLITSNIKNRQYSSDTIVKFKGKEYPAKLFTVLETVDVEKVNDGHWDTNFQGIEVYAKGIGLVYYKKNIEGNPKEFKLEELNTLHNSN